MDKLKNTSATGLFLGALLGMVIGIAMDSFAVGVGIAIIFAIAFGINGDGQDEDI